MRPTLLAQEKLDSFAQSIKTDTARIAQLTSSTEDLRNKDAEISEKIKKNKQQIEELSKESREIQHTLNLYKKELFDRTSSIRETQAMLDTNALSQRVCEEYDKQTGFYQILEKRIKILQDGLADGFTNFTNFINPATAVKNIQSRIESNSFDEGAVSLRELKGNYEQSIWNLSDRKANGEHITPQEAKNVLDRLDKALLSNSLSSYWNSQ